MCPDFPKPPPAEVDYAAIWGYATRSLTDKAGFTISGTKTTLDDLQDIAQADILSDATPFPGASIDATISSRSSHAQADVWTVATRELSGLVGQPRTDLIGEDASFEGATGRPAKIPRLDQIPAYETPVEASTLMDGTEQVLVEKTDDKIGVLDGYVDLTPMVAGDQIIIRQYMQVKAAGAYVKYAQETYDDAQTIPLLHITTKTAKDKIKVTAEQTNVAYKTLDVQFYRKLQA